MSESDFNMSDIRSELIFIQSSSETQSGPQQTSKMESYVTVVNGCGGPGYASETLRSQITTFDDFMGLRHS